MPYLRIVLRSVGTFRTFASRSVIVSLVMMLVRSHGRFSGGSCYRLAIVYWGVRFALRPAEADFLSIDPVQDAVLLEHVMEVAVVASLSLSGLKVELVAVVGVLLSACRASRTAATEHG